jgi:beta-lactamase regulating signal transducer with metallopeptidase domain
MNFWMWWLAQNTITAAVMIPLVVLACQFFRRRPAVQHAFWVVVLLKLLTPPLVSWPWSAEQLRDAIWSLPVSEHKVNGAASRVRADQLPGPKESPHADAVSTAVATVEQTESTFAPTAPDVQPPSTAMRLAFQLSSGAWLLGAILCGTLQLRRIGRHASIIRRGTAPPEQLIAEVKATAKRLGMKPPRAILARGILSPFLWCLGCLRLVWPEAMASNIEIARSRGVIAHELAHVRRRDHWVAWLELAGGVVWWWNPLFFFVRRRLRETAEIACDALAIATNHGSRREYAEMLLELSAGFQSGAPVPVLAVSAGAPSSFERRLSMILSERISGTVSSWGILVAIGFALVTLPGWSLGQQKEPTKEQPPAAEERVKSPATSEQEKEAFTAWGKEVGGLQAGLGLRPGEKRAYHTGETVRLVVRVRNVSKEAVKFEYLRQFFIENPPAVTYPQGELVPLQHVEALGFHSPRKVNLAPEKEIELYELKLELRLASEATQATQLQNLSWPPGPSLYGTGKFQIQYERVFGNSSAGTIKLDLALSKLATGKLELEIKSDPPPATDKKTNQAENQAEQPKEYLLPDLKIEAGLQGINVQAAGLQGSASHIAFDNAKGILVLDGTKDVPAILAWKGQSEEVRAARIIYSLKDGTLRAESVGWIRLRPPRPNENLDR